MYVPPIFFHSRSVDSTHLLMSDPLMPHTQCSKLVSVIHTWRAIITAKAFYLLFVRILSTGSSPSKGFVLTDLLCTFMLKLLVTLQCSIIVQMLHGLLLLKGKMSPLVAVSKENANHTVHSHPAVSHTHPVLWPRTQGGDAGEEMLSHAI
jgi:hypothetical protein